MLKNKYSLGVITGIVSCLIISSLVTQVVANSFSFLGPSGTNPPNGLVTPTLDGLTINGDLTVTGITNLKPLSPNLEHKVETANLYTDRINSLENQILTLFSGDTNQSKIRLLSKNIELSYIGGSTEIMGNARVIGSSHFNGDITRSRNAKFGSTYTRSFTLTMNNGTIGASRTAAVSCDPGTELYACQGYVGTNSQRGFLFEGSVMIGRSCYTYARQDKATTSPVYLDVRAYCRDPLGVITN